MHALDHTQEDAPRGAGRLSYAGNDGQVVRRRRDLPRLAAEIAGHGPRPFAQVPHDRAVPDLLAAGLSLRDVPEDVRGASSCGRFPDDRLDVDDRVRPIGEDRAVVVVAPPPGDAVLPRVQEQIREPVLVEGDERVYVRVAALRDLERPKDADVPEPPPETRRVAVPLRGDSLPRLRGRARLRVPRQRDERELRDLGRTCVAREDLRERTELRSRAGDVQIVAPLPGLEGVDDPLDGVLDLDELQDDQVVVVDDPPPIEGLDEIAVAPDVQAERTDVFEADLPVRVQVRLDVELDGPRDAGEASGEVLLKVNVPRVCGGGQRDDAPQLTRDYNERGLLERDGGRSV